MSKSELINSSSEDENNGAEEKEISDDKYFSAFLKLWPYMCKPCVSKESVKGKCSGKEWSDSEEDTSRIGNAVWCSCGKYTPMAAHVESICCLDKWNLWKLFQKYTFTHFEIFLSSNLLRRK